ncbi:hypothetical protein [Novosphingobium sp. Gsoil 351]|uniref:hypothetical protein n=1 Tax=Novosphingobium sp. Gsoil 351 TaxID=2675225 RepID=UPI0018A87F34|nr:hypothetical protein [Novosphingobium sp. Gsoil 351]
MVIRRSDPGLYPELARATDGAPRRVNQIKARLLPLPAAEQFGRSGDARRRPG